MKTTKYFDFRKIAPDRAFIQNEWIAHVLNNPEASDIQPDGRIRKWAKIEEYGNRYLRVILLPDGETVHNAFFDRDFRSINHED